MVSYTVSIFLLKICKLRAGFGAEQLKIPDMAAMGILLW